MAPSFYVGHSEQMMKKYPMPMLNYDWRNTRRFVAPKLPGLLVPKETKSKYDVAYNKEVLPPRCNTTLGSYIDEEILYDSWKLIHNITLLYPGSEVSGGIFLYPRQSMLISYLIQREIASRAAQNDFEPFRVCETGFGSGHSAALFLSSHPNVEVVSFDKFDRPYQNAAFLALRGVYGKRLTRSIGDSCLTVKAYGKQCDFLHGSSLCRTDNIDLIHNSGAGVTLTSTAMKVNTISIFIVATFQCTHLIRDLLSFQSLEDRSVYFGNNAQWATLRKQHCISNIVCFEDEEIELDKNLHLARGKQQRIAHKFCFAVNTGNCTKKKRPAARSSWKKDDFCPGWMLSPPFA